jgi:hypothetical protein
MPEEKKSKNSGRTSSDETNKGLDHLVEIPHSRLVFPQELKRKLDEGEYDYRLQKYVRGSYV